MDYGQAIKAGADSGISAMVGELDDAFGSKKQLSTTNRKKASQATGLIDDAADAPRPRTNALPDVEVTPSRGAVKNATSGLADAGAGTGSIGRKSNTTALSKDKLKNAKKSSPSLSKNQQKMQSQTVGNTLSGNTTEKIKASNTNIKKIPKLNSGADNIAQGAKLKEYYRQAEKYGAGSIKEMNNGKIRFYGEIKPANKKGEMMGARLVREWNPYNDGKREWYETLDHAGKIRQVRPSPNITGGIKVHYMFDANGKYIGSWSPTK